MRVFILLEIAAIGLFLWLAANILRYLFFKEHGGGGLFFGLSEGWIGPRRSKKRGKAEPEEFKAEETEEERKS